MLESAFSSVVLGTALIIAGPGLLVGIALGLRGWTLCASAPLLTYGIVGVVGPVFPTIGIPWGPGVLALTASTLALLVMSIALMWRRWRPPTTVLVDTKLPEWRVLHQAGIALGVIVAAVVGFSVAAAATKNFQAIPQIWDSIFHANATRYIADTGRSDPSALQNLNNPTVSSYYYPNAYHVIAATVVMLSSSTVPAVLDVSVALFPLWLAAGMAALVRQCGGRPALAAAAAILSCAFTAFPYDLLPWGTLLPFITAMSLLPGFLALFAAMLRSSGRPIIGLPVMLAIAGLGLLALHPSVAVAAVVFGLALSVQTGASCGLRLGHLRAAAWTVVTAAVIGSPLLLSSLGAASGLAYDWPTTLRPAEAMGQVLFFSHEQPYPQFWLVGLALLGALRTSPLRPFGWLIAGSAVFATLFVMAASYEGQVVSILTSFWWNDKWRLAALWTIGAIMLAAGGLVAIRDGVWAAARRLAPSESDGSEYQRIIASGAVLAVAAAAVVLVTDGLYYDRNEARLAKGFTDGPAISSAESAAFTELARLVPQNSLVMNDPYDGSAMMWALADVRPVFASPVISPQELPTMDPNRRVLFESFDELDRNPDTQQAVRNLNIHYVIICSGFVPPADGHVAGMQDLDSVEALDLVFANSDARIYAVALPEPVPTISR